MIPMTHEEIQPRKPQGCCRFWTMRNVAIFVALHGVISTLLLPLTVRGPIGGQYGMLIDIGKSKTNNELLSVTDMSFAHEMFLISLLFLAHLIGFVSVIKKSRRGMVFYMLVRLLEYYLYAFWMRSVDEGTIKSHVMSQNSLGWYCFVSFAIQCPSLLVLVIDAFFDIPITTMIPLTNEEIQPRKPQGCCPFWTMRNVAIFIALHGVISTLLLPLTIRGSIGGQYGMLVLDGNFKQKGMSLTDVPFAVEMFLISLLFLVHSFGLKSVIKKSMKGMAFYSFFLMLETSLTLSWFGSVGAGIIKSHVMSQDSLDRYCFVSLVIQFISVLTLMMFAFYPDEMPAIVWDV